MTQCWQWRWSSTEQHNKAVKAARASVSTQNKNRVLVRDRREDLANEYVWIYASKKIVH